MTLDKRHTAREKTLLRYTGALERGDVDELASVLREAENDPALARMIAEINDVYSAEASTMLGSARPPANGHLSPYSGLQKKESIMQAMSTARDRLAPRSRISWTLAAAMLAFVLFGALLLAWMGQTAPHVPLTVAGAVQGSTDTPTAASSATPIASPTQNAKDTQATLKAWATQIIAAVTQTAAVIPLPVNAAATARAVITGLPPTILPPNAIVTISPIIPPPPTIVPPATLPFVKTISIEVSSNTDAKDIQALAIAIIEGMARNAGYSEVWLTRPNAVLAHYLLMDIKLSTTIPSDMLPGTVMPGDMPPGTFVPGAVTLPSFQGSLMDIAAWLGQSDTLPLQIQMSNFGALPLYIEIRTGESESGGASGGSAGIAPTPISTATPLAR